MTNSEKANDQIIETLDEEGNVVKFELLDIIEVEEIEYGLLLPMIDKKEDDEEVVLMRLKKEGEEFVFEAIEDDAEFDKVVKFIESLEETDEEEE